MSSINRAAIPLLFEDNDYDPLLQWIGDRKLVLIGEASHGTHDFYRERALITRRLIEEKGFSAVAIEGDWPDTSRVHSFLQGGSCDKDARAALNDFRRFPAWMWRNIDVLAFIDWLSEFNRGKTDRNRVGFYGLDLYSMHTAMQKVLEYLDSADPEAAKRARSRYACFDHFGEDTQAYGYAAAFGLTEDCEQEVVAQLIEMRRWTLDRTSRHGSVAPDDYLFAEQNARLVQNAERYYRSMFAGRAESWNVRDEHMAETLLWLSQYVPGGKVVVWAHNSHLGDARATEMALHGEHNLGQLMREHDADDVFLIGFTTYSGEVTAASQWDGPAERKIVRPALKGSFEALFHETGISGFLLSLHDEHVSRLLDEPHLERAIGVIYRPETERVSHYFHSRLSRQFDAVIHMDRTMALIPFELASRSETGEVPETYPFAL
ncbi:erythromycin esterase family protein [Terriglobus albidus]|uniref:erythromycin esterase family protein n=1 Tax=Terriglobus albidus TaxID=1592106 RepID=UPI0021DFAB10|nr:erythromycin esterase family protein [Terriglobus albidus]